MAALSDGTLSPLVNGTVTLRLRDGRVVTGNLRGYSATDITLVTSASQSRTIERDDVLELRLVTAPVVSTADLARALGQQVFVRLQNGRELNGELLAFDSNALTLVADGGLVVSLPRGEVQAMAPSPPPPPGPRVGINLGLLPSVMVDVDAGLFRAYINAAVAIPAALSGKMYGVGLGVGIGIPVAPDLPNLKLDVLAQFNVMGVASACSACNYPTAHTFGFGLAVGVHSTLDSGFTVGVTIPIIGYSVTPEYKGSASTAVGYYFLSSAVAMPLAYLGYRF